MKKTESKTYTLRFAAVNKPTWDAIKNGTKTVETRAATVKYQSIKAGDTLVLSCAGKTCKKKVKKAKKFKTIAALLKVYNAGCINPGVTTLKEMEAMYYSYPGYKEKIAQYGLVALELE